MFCFRRRAGALSYAELGTMNTSSGAEWAYFMDAFGAAPAFLFSWVSTLVLKPSQMAIICLSFAQYAVEAFVSECDPPIVVVKMVALLAVGMYIFTRSHIMTHTSPLTNKNWLPFLFSMLNGGCSEHFMRQLLQRQLGRGRAECVHHGENGCGCDYHLRWLLQIVSRQCSTFRKCI